MTSPDQRMFEPIPPVASVTLKVTGEPEAVEMWRKHAREGTKIWPTPHATSGHVVEVIE